MYKFIDKGSAAEKRLIKQSGLKNPTSSEVFHLRQKANQDLNFKRYEHLQDTFRNVIRDLDPAAQSQAWGYIEKGVGLHRGREGRGITESEFKNINRRIDKLRSGDVKDVIRKGNVGLEKARQVRPDTDIETLLDKVGDYGYGDSIGNTYQQEHVEDLRTGQQALKAIKNIKTLTIGRAQNFINELESEAFNSLPSWLKSTVEVLHAFVDTKGALTQIAANRLYQGTLNKLTEGLAIARKEAAEDALAELLELIGML